MYNYHVSYIYHMIFPLNHPFIDDSPLFSICSHDIAIETSKLLVTHHYISIKVIYIYHIFIILYSHKMVGNSRTPRKLEQVAKSSGMENSSW